VDGHVARMGKMIWIFWFENLKGRDHLGDLGVGGKIILVWILGIEGGRVWTGLIWLRISGGPF